MEENKIFKIRHSLSHLMSMAVLDMFGHQKVGLGVGPVIEHGFYQDYDLRGEKLSEEVFEELENKIKEYIKKDIEFTTKTRTVEEALAFYGGDSYNDEYKRELIQDLAAKGETEVSFYVSDWYDNLCKGPHVENTSQINPEAFKLMSVAGAYWRGDEKNKMLTRIYGVAFESPKELRKHLAFLEEAKKRDHKVLGAQLDLFTFSDLVGAGLPLWTPRGTVMRNALDEFVWELRRAKGYEKVEIPHITKKDLYVKSGHWDKFKDELFRVKTREGKEYCLKPMNCPHHTQIFASKQRSYRDLPLRFANTTMVYRDEQSGELSGLSRVLSITQDDAHVFCRNDQVKDEMLKIWDIIDTFYTTVGFTGLQVRLSFHDPDNFDAYLGEREDWLSAESQLRDLVTEKGMTVEEVPGEAAFYGPKIDFMGKDSLGREWQVATIQLDMNMPERFELNCINEKGDKETVIMIHAAIMGSIERFASILISHFAGKFPVWLAPQQIQIATVADRHIDVAQQYMEKLKDLGARVQIDISSETIGKKIKNAAQLKIPYTIVFGDKECDGQDLQIKVFGTKEQLRISQDEFVTYLENKIQNRELEY